jgi:hypothetical protein
MVRGGNPQPSALLGDLMAVIKQTIIREIWPLLAVQDINRSVEFYRDRLGFTGVG